MALAGNGHGYTGSRLTTRPSPIGSLLPPHLVSSLAASGPPALPHEERLDAALLLSDISGFTALTERLQEQGREGAEEMARVVSTAFSPAIDAIAARGGSIAWFAGDAIFSIFLGPDRDVRAAEAARAIQSSFAAAEPLATRVGPVKLAIRQALHAGAVRGLHVGGPGRRLYLVAGAPVRALVVRQAMAPEGGIATGRPRPRRPAAPGASAAPPLAPPAPPPDDVLRPYLRPQVAALLPSFEGAFRLAAILFLESRATALRDLQDLHQELTRRLDGLGGMLVEADVSPHGTRWLCAFGIPTGHEDDVTRAARLALELPRALGAARLRGGLHAGTVANVLVGNDTRRNYSLVGDAVNTAARVLARAPWGTTLATEAARRQLRRIVTSDSGWHRLKGKADAMPLHALLGETQELTDVHALAPLVGRDAEMRWLLDAIDGAARGRGSLLAIQGEAGLGKSRLVWEITSLARERGYGVGIGRANAMGSRPWEALADLLRHLLGDAAATRAALGTLAQRLGLSRVDERHIADILGLEASPPTLGPEASRLNAHLAVRSLLLARSREGPQVWVLEDMQWADQASREAMGEIGRAARNQAALLVMTSRPGSPLPPHADARAISELPEGAVREMLTAILGRVPDGVLRLVQSRAEGNPLYVEEIVRTLLESGVLRLADGGYVLEREPATSEVPAGIEGLIQSRIDRLSPDARRVLQVAAVIGRPFPRELLRHVEGLAASPAVMEDLRGRQLLVERPEAPLLGLKHAMTRDVVYAGILSSRRRELHRTVAQAMEQAGASFALEQPALLGEHWDRAGEPDRARPHYLLALRGCARHNAALEARRLFHAYRALQATPTPESIDARRVLVGILHRAGLTHEALAEAELLVAESHGQAPTEAEAKAILERARVLVSLGRGAQARADLDASLELARRTGARLTECTALQNLASLHLRGGDPEAAGKLFAEARDIARDIDEPGPEASSLQGLALISAQTRDVARAGELCEEVLGIFQRIGDLPGESYARANLATNLAIQGRAAEAIAHYERALQLAREHGERRFIGYLLGNLGTVRKSLGQLAETEILYREALAIQREVGAGAETGFVLGNLANLAEQSGRPEEARAYRDEALALARSTGERVHEGVLLVDGARARRRAGDLDGAAEELRRGEAILAAAGERQEHAKALCEQGMLALARGGDASDLLRRVADVREGLGLPGDSDLGVLEAELRRASGGGLANPTSNANI